MTNVRVRTIPLLFACAFLAHGASVLGQGTGVMVAHPTNPAFGGAEPSSVAAIGDLDGDGDQDVIIGNTSGGHSVWLNDGTGVFTAHPVTPTFGAGSGNHVALGDLDGDNDLDAVVANAATEAETVWLNDGSGSFTAHPTTPSFGAAASRHVALGDLDGDTDLDAVVANDSGQAETVWLNDGSGSFSIHPVTPSFGAGDSLAVLLGDLDGDGDFDAVVANASSAAETVWLNDGVGTFSPHGTTPSFGAGTSLGAALGDLDGDSDLDLVVANSAGGAETVWLNDGTGSFSAHPTTPSFGTGDSFAVVLGDLDGDGDLDAVVANGSAAAETVWRNDGSGNMTAHSTQPSFGAGDSTDVALADLNGDGALDAVVANNNAANTVWLNALLIQITGVPTTPVTTEAGAQFQFSVVLGMQPTDDVTIALASSDATEAAVSTPNLVFTNANWDEPQVVTITGVDDFVDDGDIAYQVLIGPATSPDSAFDGADPADVDATNLDDDSVGITVSPTTGLVTAEDGSSDTFSVVLASQPVEDVTITLASSDPGEGSVSAPNLVFTSANWDEPQVVTITGVDDFVDDGDIAYQVLVGPAASLDSAFDGVDPADVDATNLDDDSVGIIVSPTTGLVTAEDGSSDTFTVVLASQPLENVTITLASSDPGEGSVSAPNLVFTSSNWNEPQVVSITGVDDFVDDGDIAYQVLVGPAASLDSGFDGVDPADVDATNLDDDSVGIIVSPTTGLVTAEDGSSDTFTVVLASQPLEDVTITLASSDTTEGTVAPSSLVFTAGNWNVPQVVTVTGVADAITDGTIAYQILVGPVTSLDTVYAAIDPADVDVRNAEATPVTPIPALSEWAALLLIMWIAVVAVRRIGS